MTNMHRYRLDAIIFIITVGVLSGLGLISGQASETYNDTRKLLSALGSVRGMDAQLATLFQTGDERISDLVQALNDPDQTVRRNAQVVIRYLGNDEGMKALIEKYGTSETIMLAGSVPLPLREWDYKFISTYYQNRPQEWDTRAGAYIYALAFDGSPKAKAMLDGMVRSANKNEGSAVAHLAIENVQTGQTQKLLTGQDDLAGLVQSNAFFVAPEDRQHTSARLLGLNGLKDKALVEIHINRGRLSEEWYHVVVKKCGPGWKFFSITQVAVS
jgi:hypothetical protein